MGTKVTINEENNANQPNATYFVRLRHCDGRRKWQEKTEEGTKDWRCVLTLLFVVIANNYKIVGESRHFIRLHAPHAADAKQW